MDTYQEVGLYGPLPLPYSEKMKMGVQWCAIFTIFTFKKPFFTLYLNFFLFPQLKAVNLHFLTPVISPTLHFFTLKNPNPQSSKKISTPPKMIHPHARGYSHRNHQDGLIQHNIHYGQKYKQLSSHMHREDNS